MTETYQKVQKMRHICNFEYFLSWEFLDKKYEIELLKLNGELEIDSKINKTNSKFYIVDEVGKNNNQVIHFLSVSY